MPEEAEKTPIYHFVISGLILLTYVWLAIPDSVDYLMKMKEQ